jgi:Protein of unknown function (DUF1044).
MKTGRTIIEISSFSRKIDRFLDERKVLKEDFDDLKKSLAKDPEQGKLIPGTGGVRKTRLKSATKGKRGGFRICYFNDSNQEELFLMNIYPKNEKEDLSADEKKALKEFSNRIKGR